MTPISLRPSTFVEGGAVPVDMNLLWKECRFNVFDYTKKDGTVVASTCAARITFVADDGTEFEQQYSVGDLERFQPSDDGKTLVAVGSAEALSKSSNFYLLLNALINAGYPENKLDDDISTLDGLYAHHIGTPEPKRAGLKRTTTEEAVRERVISVPDQILRLPGEGKGKVKKADKSEGAGDEEAAIVDAIVIAKGLLKDADTTTRQKVAAAALRAKNKAAAGVVFEAEFEAALMASGLALDGEDITAV